MLYEDRQGHNNCDSCDDHNSKTKLLMKSELYVPSLWLSGFMAMAEVMLCDSEARSEGGTASS